MQLEIHIQQEFPQPLATVFGDLSDHQKFGTIVNANIKRVRDSQTSRINGVGSVRRISSLLLPPFEETVTAFIPNQLIEYEISKGSPLKNHHGKLVFSETEQGCVLNYTIVFEPKTHLPGWGLLLKRLIRSPIASGLRVYAKTPRT